MAISFVGDGSDTQNDLSLNIPWPATDSGDVAVLVWRYRNNQSGHTDPSGFVQIDEHVAGTDSAAAYYRVCDGSESGNVTMSVGVHSKQQAILTVYRGVDGTNPVNASNSATSAATPSVTTSVADTALIVSLSTRSGSVNTYTPPSGYTARGGANSIGTSGGGASTLGVADSVTTRSSGTINPPDYTTDSTNNAISWTIALAPGSTGEDFNEAATALSTNASLGNATGSVDANATSPLNTEASLTSQGTADASTTTELVTDTSLTSVGSAATFSTTDLRTEVTLGPLSSEAQFFSDVDALSSAAGITASGTAAASASAELSLEASSDTTGAADVVVVSDLFEAVALFSESTANLDTDTSASFSLEVSFTASGSASRDASTVFSTEVSVDAMGDVTAVSDADSLSAQGFFDIVATESGDTATAAFTVSVSVSAVADVDLVASATLESLGSFGASATHATSTDTALRVSANYGTATIYQDPLELLISLSVTDTAIPDPLMDTEIDEPGVDTVLPDPATSTALPSEELVTVLGDTSVETSIPDPLMDTEIDEPGVDTVIDGPEVTTAIPDVGITTSANGGS